MTLLKTILLSPDEPRLRAGWRLLIQTIVLLVISTCVGLPLILLTGSLGASESLLPLEVAEFMGISLSIFLARRFLDKRSFKGLGLKIDGQALVDVVAGFGITFVMMGLIYVGACLLGWLTFSGYAWNTDSTQTVISQISISFLGFILVGWNEELLSRGYHLQNLEDGLNTLWAVIISSAIFGGLHLNNPNAIWLSALGIFFAGVFLAYGYLRTRQLWLPIGLHIGWNFFEGVIFGFPVSGIATYRLIRTSVTGPELWTGGLFGPEAGLLVLPALLLGAFLVNIYTRKRVRARVNDNVEPELDKPTQ
jgi:membrane protease YdiL (CAAX protease family)